MDTLPGAILGALIGLLAAHFVLTLRGRFR